MPPQTQPLALTYFPHLNLGGVPEIDFGFAKVWNFDLKKNDYIPDAATRAHVEKILATHVSHFHPVGGIGIFMAGPMDFHEPTEEENELMRFVRLILFISFVARSNTIKPGPNAGHFMATSENFDVLLQRMVVGTDYITENTGEIVRFMLGGLDMNKIRFQKPGYVPRPSPFGMDNDLFNGLLALRAKKPRVFEKVMNATEIFFQSYYNSPYVSRSARILLQASAFEIILDLPEQNQRMAFKQAIKSIAYLPGEPLLTHYSERGSAKKAKEKISLKEIWADTFYSLRNHIIHGLTPSHSEYVFKNAQPHFDIALLFFVLAVKKQIERSLPAFPCNHEIKWETWEDDLVIPPQKRAGFVYNFSFRSLFRARSGRPKATP